MSKIFIVPSFIPPIMREGEVKNIKVEKIKLNEAKELVKKNETENFVTHPTVLLLGIEPTKERKNLEYEEGTLLTLKPLKRLQWGREYSVEEIKKIGVDILVYYVE